MTDVQLLVVAPYPQHTAPGQRFRFEQYLDVWRAAGIEPTVRSLLTPTEAARLYRPDGTVSKAMALGMGLGRRLSDLLTVRRFDAVYVFREAFSVGPPVLEWLLARSGVPYILDFDDAIWLPNSTAANRRFAALKYTKKTASIAAWADLVTVGNQYLADWARQHQANVRIIPTTIDTSWYRPAPTEVTPGDGRLCIGWSGSTTTVQHLRTIESVLADVQRERGVRLRVIGDETVTLPGADVEFVRWRDATEVDDLQPIDIGIMPLPDDEWARGKCGAKALQYMALEIPTVMSPVGVNADIASGGAALLASTPAEWRAALLGLLDDADQRRRVGVAGRQRVVDRYSVEVNAPRYVDAVRSVLR